MDINQQNPMDKKEDKPNDIELRRLDLELRRLELDAELRRGELLEKKAEREANERQQAEDNRLKLKELELQSGRWRVTTAQSTVLAAALAVVSGIAGAGIQWLSTRDVEASRSNAQIAIERLKAEGGIKLEEQKQNAAERLERKKFETSLIDYATHTPDKKERVDNLKFYVDAGFIEDPEGKIKKLADAGQVPVSRPTRSVAKGVPADEVEAFIEDLKREGGAVLSKTEESPGVWTIEFGSAGQVQRHRE